MKPISLPTQFQQEVIFSTISSTRELLEHTDLLIISFGESNLRRENSFYKKKKKKEFPSFD